MASLCRNKATLFRVPLKALCEWAEADRAHQPDRKIIRHQADQHWQQRAPTLRKGWGPKSYTDSNRCFLIITPRQTPKEEAKLFSLDTSSPAFVIKDLVVTVLIYLRAEIIFAFGKLHPLAGKLQPSLWGTSTSTVVMLFSSFKTKGNSSFPDVLCVCWEMLD